ncbi:MAG: hypothetical protein K6E28_03620 [Eubacterium sp.]|nr:hypothetical protein [Eubacterium sp.]
MNRLVRAELYRLRHTGHLFWYAVFLPMLFIFMPCVLCMDMMDQPLDSSIESLGTMCVLVYNFFPALVAFITGQLFNKGKLGYYEVMAGNKPSNIIMSKIFSDGIFFSVVYTVCVSAFYVFLGIKNGVGTITHPFIRLVLFAIVMTHLVVTSIMIMMASKKTISAVVLAYVRFMVFDIAVMPALAFVVDKLGFTGVRDHIGRMIVFNQLEMAAMEPLNITTTLHIILGFIGEFIFWYIIVYRGIKKRHFA